MTLRLSGAEGDPYPVRALPAAPPLAAPAALPDAFRGIDVERGAAGELNRVFRFKLMELLEKRLPDIGDGHLTFNSDFHKNNLMQITWK
jgi:hypothetical protein